MPPAGDSPPAGALADQTGLPASGSGQLEASRPAFGLDLVLSDEAEAIEIKAGIFLVFRRGGTEGDITHQDSGGGPLPPDRGGLLGPAPAVLESTADRAGTGP